MDQISAVSIIQRMNTKCEPDVGQLVDLLSKSLQRPSAEALCLQTTISSAPEAESHSWNPFLEDSVVSLAERHASRRRFSTSLSYGRHFSPPLPGARRAAVMVLIEPRATGWSIPLTVRPNHLPDHPGQICLPGGRLETGESVKEAAEREFCEELGLNAFPVDPIGELQSIYVFNSNFYLTPCVAVVDHELDYQPNPSEVESVVHLPIEHLLDLNRHVVQSHSRGKVTWSALGIQCEGIHVWGATAIVLGELAAILNRR